MKEVFLVRCDRTKPDGDSCMTLYPAETPSHEGPCLYCWNDMQRAAANAAWLSSHKKSDLDRSGGLDS